jgi:hypothetical protein
MYYILVLKENNLPNNSGSVHYLFVFTVFFGVQIWSVHVVFMARSVSQFFIETHEQENTSYGRGKRHQQVISVLFDSQKVGIRGTS